MLLWNIGVVLVPAGVLADVRFLVAIGSVALIVALLLFLEVLLPDRRARRSMPTTSSTTAARPSWLSAPQPRAQFRAQYERN